MCRFAIVPWFCHKVIYTSAVSNLKCHLTSFLSCKTFFINKYLTVNLVVLIMIDTLEWSNKEELHVPKPNHARTFGKLENVSVSQGCPFVIYGPTINCVPCKIWT